MKTKKNTRKTVIGILICVAVLIIGIILVTAAVKNNAVPDIVQETARMYVEQEFAKWQGSDYSDWRMKSLEYAYTYYDFEGMTLQVYRVNYEFLAIDPENIALPGGMSIDEEGWVVPGYPNSEYLIFKQEGKKLSYLTDLFENDCQPGDETFTNDMKRWISDIN